MHQINLSWNRSCCLSLPNLSTLCENSPVVSRHVRRPQRSVTDGCLLVFRRVRVHTPPVRAQVQTQASQVLENTQLSGYGMSQESYAHSQSEDFKSQASYPGMHDFGGPAFHSQSQAMYQTQTQVRAHNATVAHSTSH